MDCSCRTATGFKTLYRPKAHSGMLFGDLLHLVASVNPGKLFVFLPIIDCSSWHLEIRIRFTSPHPKDFPDDLIAQIASTPVHLPALASLPDCSAKLKLPQNICKALHIPAQSGSTSVLERMRRGYAVSLLRIGASLTVSRFPLRYSREAYLSLIDRIRLAMPGVAISTVWPSKSLRMLVHVSHILLPGYDLRLLRRDNHRP
jgi:hypothetical protein